MNDDDDATVNHKVNLRSTLS